MSFMRENEIRNKTRVKFDFMCSYFLDDLPLKRMPSQARSREKVARALEAAERLLDRFGPEAVNLTQVASEAGLSAGALHQYLPDREAILDVLAARYHSRLESLLQEALETPGPGRATPLAEIEHVLGAVEEIYRDEAAVRSLRLGLGGEASRRHKDRMAVILEKVLVRRGLVEKERAGAVARVLFFAADGVLKEAFRQSGQGDEEMLAILGEMIRSLLERA